MFSPSSATPSNFVAVEFNVATYRDNERFLYYQIIILFYIKIILTDHSHSVVPGGFGVRSYRTREIPHTVDISRTSLSITIIGSLSDPGVAGTPVIKSLVRNGRITIDL